MYLVFRHGVSEVFEHRARTLSNAFDVVNVRLTDAGGDGIERAAIFETLKKRVDSGGMVMANSDLYPVMPIGTDFSDIVFPVSSWGEDNFTRCNSERRLRLYSKFYDAPGESKPDWWIVQKLAQKMGFDKDGGYAWKDSNDVFEEAARFSRGGVLNYHPLATRSTQKW